MPDHLLLLNRKQWLQQAGGQHLPQLPVIEIPLSARVPQLQLHRPQGTEQRIHGTARHGISHGHIHVVIFRRKRVKQRQQQRFIRQHERRFNGIAILSVAKNLFCKLGLPYGGGHTDHRYLRPSASGDGKGLRKVQDIALHEERGLIGLVLNLRRHIVPHELRQAGVPHAGQHRPFTFVQGVQAHEHVPGHFRKGGLEDIGHGRSGLQAAGQGTVNLPFVRHPFGLQSLVEALVQREQQVPQTQEPGLHVIGPGVQAPLARSIPEMRQEMADGLLLAFAQVFKLVLDGFEVSHILHELLRIHQVFVHVVKIGQKHFSPEEELVQRFRLGIQDGVAAVKFQQQTQAVRYAGIGHLIKEVVDGVERRHQHRPSPGGAQKVSQVLFEEYQGAAVGEDEASALYIPSRQIMRGHLLQKRLHNFAH